MLRCLFLPHTTGRGIKAAFPFDASALFVSRHRQSRAWSSDQNKSRSNRVVTLVNRDNLPLQYTSESQPEPHLVDIASSPVAPYALCALRRSLATLDSGSVPTHTPVALKALYYTVKAQSQLYLLSDGDFSTLISFYASLSVLADGGAADWTELTTFHLHPAAALANSPGSHWSFVASVAYDMRAYGRQDSSQDRFWLMRAALANASVLARQRKTADRTRNFYLVLSYGRREYNQIRDQTHHADVHVPWLAALLSFGTTPLLNEALFNCARLIRRAPEIDAKLQAVIWRIVSASCAVASPEMRHEFCVALRRRLDVGSRGPQHKPFLMVPPFPRAHLEHQSVLIDDILDLQALHALLAVGLFSGRSLPSGHPLLPWSLRELRDIVGADTTTLWRHLALFALGHNATAGCVEAPSLLPVKSFGQLRTWSLASALLVLQVTYRLAENVDVLRGGAHAILRTLWHAWIALDSTRRRKRTPFVVERILWLGFIRTAGIVGDNALLSEICTIDRFKSRLLQNSAAGAAAISFSSAFCKTASVEIASAAAACGVQTWEGVLSRLESAQVWQEELDLRKIVADVFIRAWTQPGREAGVALKLYTDATSYELVSNEGVCTVAQACLRDGLIREAFTCLADPAFRDEVKAGFVDTLLSRLRSRGVRGLPQDMAATLGKTMYDLAMSQRQLLHARSWEWSLSALARSGCAPLVVNVSLALAEHHPRLCSRRWWTTFTHQLCNERLFGVALRLARGMPSTHEARRAISLALVRRLGDASASRLAWRAWELLAPGRVPARVMLLQTVGFRGHTPTLGDTRSIIPFLFPDGQPRSVGPKAYALALRLLARSKRRRAAKRLYKHIQSTHPDPALKAQASNTILAESSRWSRRRNARHFRRLLAVLNRLVTEDGFIPNRVTFNILLKAILRWRVPVDAPRLRVLFDRVVTSGLLSLHANTELAALDDGTRKAAAKHLLFGTPDARTRRLPSSIRSLPSLEGPLDFERHVRPLYKMFVRAFRDRGDREAARKVVRVFAAERKSKDVE